jgi:hypothetical protein
MKPMTEDEKAEQIGSKERELKNETTIMKAANKSDNVAYTLHSMELVSLPPMDARVCQAEDLEDRCYKYIEICVKDNMKPSLAGLALSLDVSRTTLIKYINGEAKIPTENRYVLQRFNGVLNALLEDYMQNGKINPVAAIFIAKNNFGYKDMQEYVVNNTNQEETTPEGLIEEANLLLSAEPKKANEETE